MAMGERMEAGFFSISCILIFSVTTIEDDGEEGVLLCFSALPLLIRFLLEVLSSICRTICMHRSSSPHNRLSAMFLVAANAVACLSSSSGSGSCLVSTSALVLTLLPNITEAINSSTLRSFNSLSAGGMGGKGAMDTSSAAATFDILCTCWMNILDFTSFTDTYLDGP